MNRRPGHVDVTTEVGFCNFCNRTRNLRREQHHLGALVRTIVSCETCHRTLSSSVGVASTEPEPAAAPASQPEPAKAEVVAEEKAKPKRAPAKPAPAKRATKPKATGKAKVPAKPRSTATRRTSRNK
ncbi:MAG: hypothetical protein E6I36_02670 [Chloroflexi bacterium]|nr:MAG: hypothetical protein E6I36_02670 [Chloroflexota bacterium]